MSSADEIREQNRKLKEEQRAILKGKTVPSNRTDDVKERESFTVTERVHQLNNRIAMQASLPKPSVDRSKSDELRRSMERLKETNPDVYELTSETLEEALEEVTEQEDEAYEESLAEWEEQIEEMESSQDEDDEEPETPARRNERVFSNLFSNPSFIVALLLAATILFSFVFIAPIILDDDKTVVEPEPTPEPVKETSDSFDDTFETVGEFVKPLGDFLVKKWNGLSVWLWIIIFYIPFRYVFMGKRRRYRGLL